jgi:hypothetical protein
MNHGGEFVDILQVPSGATHLLTPAGQPAVPASAATGVKRSLQGNVASIQTNWRFTSAGRSVAFAQSVSLTRDASTMALTFDSPGNRIATELQPPGGIAITSAAVNGHEADLCFTTIGEEQPCVRIWARESDAVVSATDHGIAVQTSSSSRLEIYVTDLTAGGPSVGLGILDPAQLVSEHAVRAAILQTTDPSFASRVERLAALGFERTSTFDTYAVLVRRADSVP